MLRLLATLLLLGMCAATAAADIETGDPALDAAFAKLLDRDFDTKSEGVTALAASGHPQTAELLGGLLDGELRYLKKEKRLVWIQERDGESHAIDVLDGTDYGKQSKRKFKKLALNNAMRSQLRGLLAELELSDPDPAVRLAAVNSMFDSIEFEQAEVFARLLQKEPDRQVAAALDSVRAGERPAFELAGHRIGSGRRVKLELPIARLMSGTPVALPVLAAEMQQLRRQGHPRTAERGEVLREDHRHAQEEELPGARSGESPLGPLLGRQGGRVDEHHAQQLGGRR